MLTLYTMTLRQCQYEILPHVSVFGTFPTESTAISFIIVYALTNPKTVFLALQCPCNPPIRVFKHNKEANMATDKKDLLTIQQIREMTGVTSRTLRYYEQIGLIHPTARSETGYRLYDRSVADTIGRIKKYKNLGYGLKEIRHILDDPDYDMVSSLDALIETLQKRLELTEKQIAAAKEMKKDLPDH